MAHVKRGRGYDDTLSRAAFSPITIKISNQLMFRGKTWLDSRLIAISSQQSQVDLDLE